jgi:hypothetical protein
MIFKPITTLGRPNLLAATLGRGKRGIDKAFRFIQRAFIAECVSKIDELIPQNFVAAPLLKAAMHRFVVRADNLCAGILGAGGVLQLCAGNCWRKSQNKTDMRNVEAISRGIL